jgi:hypothetical protein
MKIIMRNFIFLVLFATLPLFFSCSGSKKFVKTSSEKQNELTNASVVGTWSFIVKGTPQGDVNGNMILSVNEGILKGLINSGGVQTDIRDIKVENNVLSGVFDFNQMTINMKGTFSESSYKGSVETQGYTFPMTATKN